MPENKPSPGAQKQAWLESCYPAQLERKSQFLSLSGIPLQPLYTQDDLSNFDGRKELGFPGEPPYTRGIHPTMYRGRLWTMRQLAGFGSPEETNQRYKLLLSHGATGINSVFDYPTLRGFDSDHAEAEADVGRGGVAVDSLADLRLLFEGIPLDQTSVSLVTCQPVGTVPVFAMYLALAEQRGIPFEALQGTTQNDFLLETAVTIGLNTLPPQYSFKLSCDVIEYCVKQVPRWNPISIAGYNYREAGANAIQELGLCLAHGIACVEEMLRRGLAVEEFAPRLSFFLNAHNDFFEEIAKYRAARRLWCRIMTDRFQAQGPKAKKFRFHVQTAGSALTAQQPLNNIARAAYHGLAAVLGGAQSVHIDGYDEALCTPTEASALIALRTQQILQHETNVTSTVDPLGGSYFVESLTNEMEQRVEDYLGKIEKQGGIVAAVASGWVHREIADSAIAYQRAIETKEMLVVGVNCFKATDEQSVEIFCSPETAPIQRSKLQELRGRRDDAAVQLALEDVRLACRRLENLMPAVIRAVKASATEGEITDIFRQEWGVWDPPLSF
ncbi:MAG: methylmalonyl-CoA mutase family protein [Deltaproteobacteria bacterium]|nr:methylmalonyl-CoA mutase family protein [Deltaproteobacteria bacterium]